MIAACTSTCTEYGGVPAMLTLSELRNVPPTNSQYLVGFSLQKRECRFTEPSACKKNATKIVRVQSGIVHLFGVWVYA